VKNTDLGRGLTAPNVLDVEMNQKEKTMTCIANKCYEDATYFVAVDQTKHPGSVNLELCDVHADRYDKMTRKGVDHDKAIKNLVG
jgi:hypothetical protein